MQSFTQSRQKTNYAPLLLRILIVLNSIVLVVSIFYVLFIYREPTLIISICVGLLAISAYFNNVFKDLPYKICIAKWAILLCLNAYFLLTL